MTETPFDDAIFDDEDDEEFLDCVRAKWTIDGATTFSEAAARSRSFAEYLENLENDGYQLVGPVEDDYGFYRKS